MREPVWVDEREALAIHDRMLVLHGGASGVRDAGLVLSALARPRQHFACSAYVDLVMLASVYTAGIVRNHPFVDGNKRTGFIVGVLFLELNGFRFQASEEAAAQAVLGLASGEMEEGGYRDFLGANAKRRREKTRP
jgi:death-on-curing protein